MLFRSIADVSVSDLLQESVSLVSQKALDHGVRTEVNMEADVKDLTIQADERKCKQILFNLLSNAIKFTDNGGSIVVGAKRTSLMEASKNGADAAGTPGAHGVSQSAPVQCVVGGECRERRSPGTLGESHDSDGGNDDKEYLEVSVADTGVGIATEDRESIFDDFYQTHQTTKDKTPGTGLGLSLVKQLTALHGGRVSVESEGEGEGSTFRFTLPIRQPQSPAEGPEHGGGEDDAHAKSDKEERGTWS
mgnify:CR=1 FL=1